METIHALKGYLIRAFSMLNLMSQTVKNLPAMWETWILSLGWEDPLDREWQPSPVFLLGESHGKWSLAGYSPWGCKESDNTNTFRIVPSWQLF